MSAGRILLFSVCVGLFAAIQFTSVGSESGNVLEALVPFVKMVWDPLGPKVGWMSREEHAAACAGCHGFINEINRIYDSGATAGELLGNLTQLCYALGITHFECDFIFFEYSWEIWYMLENNELDNATFCGILIGDGCGAHDSLNSWTVNINFTGYREPSIPTMPGDSFPQSKILHLSDMHLDRTYVEGSTGEGCDEIMCCSNKSEFPANSSINQVAGPWGTKGPCDLPPNTYRNMLEQIKVNHPDIDMIYLTGDTPPHDLPFQTRQRNMDALDLGAQIVKDVFGTSIPIFPSVGNHDTWPCNSFPTDDNINPPYEYLKDDWLFTNLSDIYSDWLDNEAYDMFRQHGFYTQLVTEGFRIIAVNSNYCLAYNFWTTHQWIDPWGQLQWLSDTLHMAEERDEKVHILSHVPPNSECLGAWGRELGKIIERYEDTVMNSFYGHTHRDEYFVQYNALGDHTRAVHVGFVTPSVTTWQFLNPSYRIYTVDGPYASSFKEPRLPDFPYGSLRVIDAETYIMDIDAANANGSSVDPTYFLFYDMRTDLEMDTLFPSEFDKLAYKLRDDDAMWAKYEYFYNNGNADLSSTRENVICDLVTSNKMDDRKCKQLYPDRK